jgi:hypothetical protein
LRADDAILEGCRFASRRIDDIATGHAEEQDVQEVYVKAIALDEDRRALRVADERGRAWSLDLVTHVVTRA